MEEAKGYFVWLGEATGALACDDKCGLKGLCTFQGTAGKIRLSRYGDDDDDDDCHLLVVLVVVVVVRGVVGVVGVVVSSLLSTCLPRCRQDAKEDTRKQLSAWGSRGFTDAPNGEFMAEGSKGMQMKRGTQQGIV